MRKTKLSFDLFAQQHGNDGLFAGFYRYSGSGKPETGHPRIRTPEEIPDQRLCRGTDLLAQKTASARYRRHAGALKRPETG